jgi:hypothetical protein
MWKFVVMMLLAFAVGSSALVSCGDDDDDNDTDTTIGGDADADADADTDTTITYDGTLTGEFISAGVSVQVLEGTESSVGGQIMWQAADGNVDNIEVVEFRVYLDGQVDPLFTTPPGGIIIETTFDKTVNLGAPKYIDYVHLSPSRNGFENHCDEHIRIEADATYGTSGTLTFEWDMPITQINCIEPV